jgi:hypothetical protein
MKADYFAVITDGWISMSTLFHITITAHLVNQTFDFSKLHITNQNSEIFTYRVKSG